MFFSSCVEDEASGVVVCALVLTVVVGVNVLSVSVLVGRADNLWNYGVEQDVGLYVD